LPAAIAPSALAITALGTGLSSALIHSISFINNEANSPG
jgi:hypothetical protein